MSTAETPKDEPSFSVGVMSTIIATTVRGTMASSTGPTPGQQSTAGGNGTNDKESLSVQTTTVNFKNFVEKSGPIFWLQDIVEEIVTWQDPWRTAFWAGLWAFLCLKPFLFVIVPNLIVIAILLYTYPAHNDRPSSESSLEFDGQHDPLPASEPTEGSVPYLSNMQNIQIMMGRVSQASDAVKASLVPYLDWSTPHYSLALLHASLLSSLLLLFVAPYVAWSYVLLFAGESVLFIQHPALQTFLRHLAHQLPLQKIVARLDRAIANDALPDHVLDSPAIVLVACREHQRYGGQGSGWSESFLEKSSDPRPWMQEHPHHVLLPISGLWAVQPPGGFQWVPCERWYIDHDSSTDEEGWHFINAAALAPSLRRRRWLRRAYKRAERD